MYYVILSLSILFFWPYDNGFPRNDDQFKREARQQPPFYGPDDKIAPFVAIIMGLQVSSTSELKNSKGRGGWYLDGRWLD